MTRILLVEDEELNRDMLSRRLMRRGYEVLLAEDGLQAIRVALEQLPDLIVMDMRLPELDGWQATRQLRAGCVDYDTKPIELPRLIAKIEAIVSARSAGRSVSETASGTGESA